MIELIYLLMLGFIIGLSGAMLPGPLLVYTLSESMKKGWWAGPLVIVGHMIVEVILLLLIALGVTSFINSAFFVDAVSWAGGIALVLMSLHLLKTKWSISQNQPTKNYGTIAGGFIFTAFNPGFPVWWVTAGARMLLEGYRILGLLGVAVIVVGHWLADLGYFTLISTIVHYGKQNLLNDKHINKIKNILAIILLAIGVYFIL